MLLCLLEEEEQRTGRNRNVCRVTFATNINHFHRSTPVHIYYSIHHHEVFCRSHRCRYGVVRRWICTSDLLLREEYGSFHGDGNTHQDVYIHQK